MQLSGFGHGLAWRLYSLCAGSGDFHDDPRLADEWLARRAAIYNPKQPFAEKWSYRVDQFQFPASRDEKGEHRGLST